MSAESLREIMLLAERDSAADGRDRIVDIVSGVLDGGAGGLPPLGGSECSPNAPMPGDRGRAHVDELVALASLQPNDTDNGRRLIRWYGDDILMVRDVGWHSWTGKVWAQLGGTDAVHRLAQQLARNIAVEAEVMYPTATERRLIAAADAAAAIDKARRTGADEAAIHEGKAAHTALSTRRTRRRAFALSCGNGARLAQIITQAAPHLTIGVEQIDANPLLLNLENGTLVFEEVEDLECPDPDTRRLKWEVRLKPHDRADRCAKVAPAVFDPDADCPRWLAFLELVQPAPAIKAFLQTFYGYSLLGLIGAQKLVFHYGEGANGKSTFIEALSRLVGPYGRLLNAESVTGTQSRGAGQATPDIAQLPGARIVRISELPRGEPLREALVKQLTGGEPMMARHNYGNFFEFRPSFKATMSGNDKPRIDGVDHGIWRRIALVIWGQTIPENKRRDMEAVLAEFEAERSGILNWLIDGALNYLANGLQEPPEIREATRAYRADMDQVQSFVDACVVRHTPPPDSDAKLLPSRMLYEAYEAWCVANAMKPWSEKAFSQTMVKKGFVKREGRIRHFENIILRDIPEPIAPRSPVPEEGL